MPDDALTRERVREALTEGADWCDLLSTEAVDLGAVLRDLLAALDDPARWCGVVGDVMIADESAPVGEDGILWLAPTPQSTRRLIVTPHQEGA